MRLFIVLIGVLTLSSAVAKEDIFQIFGLNQKNLKSDCRYDSDCPTNYVCHHGQCESTQQECYWDSDCPGTSTCHHGFCTGAGSGCHYDSDCPDGHYCEHGQCTDHEKN